MEFCIIKEPPVRHFDDPILIDIPDGVWYGLAPTTIAIDRGRLIRPFQVFKIEGPRKISLKYLAALVAPGDEPQIPLTFYFTDRIENLEHGLELDLSCEGFLNAAVEGTMNAVDESLFTDPLIDYTLPATGSRFMMETKLFRPSGPCPMFFKDPDVYGIYLDDLSYKFIIQYSRIYNLSSTNNYQTAVHILLGPTIALQGGGWQTTRHVIEWVATDHLLRGPVAIGYQDGSYPFKGDSNLYLIWNFKTHYERNGVYPVLQLRAAHNVSITFYGKVIVPAMTGRILDV